MAYTRARNIFTIGDLWLETGGWKLEEHLQGMLRATRFSQALHDAPLIRGLAEQQWVQLGH